MELAIVLAIALGLLNTVLTRKVLRANESGFRKGLFVVGLWLLPFFGALLVYFGIRPPPLSPSPVNDPKVPWV